VLKLGAFLALRSINHAFSSALTLEAAIGLSRRVGVTGRSRHIPGTVAGSASPQPPGKGAALL
jgi:hypothetical protein